MLEGEWGSLMNQSFLLKHYGGLSIIEQDNMTGEERSWWMRRLQEELDKNQFNGPASDHSRNHTPGILPI